MWKWILVAFAVIVGGFLVSNGCWFAGQTVQVAKEQFGPRELLRKYELFKDMHSALDRGNANIKVYESRITAMENDYEGTVRKDWDRIDKQTMSTWQSEVAGVKANFNQMASEYNAAMAKFNYAFCNVGTLPEGATEPLPREYVIYVTE